MMHKTMLFFVNADKHNTSFYLRTAFLVVVCVFLCVSLVHADDITIQMTVEDTECTDGIDNDGDLLIDFPNDPGCDSTLDNNEVDVVLAACEDTIDNDGDSLIDYPQDPGCDSLGDDDEYNAPGGGGGLSGGSSKPKTSTVKIRGFAYPLSWVYLYEDGILLDKVQASENGTFNGEIEDVTKGTHVYAFQVVDVYGERSNMRTVTIETERSSEVQIGNVHFSPTIIINKRQVKKNEDFTVFGQASPNTKVQLYVYSEAVLQGSTTSNIDGDYDYTFSSSELEYGDHTVKAVTVHEDADENDVSQVLSFSVGDTTILNEIPEKNFDDELEQGCFVKTDLNDDCHVNLIDFSIMAYWWDKVKTEEFLVLEDDHLSGDGELTLVDFSMMAYYWTG